MRHFIDTWRQRLKPIHLFVGYRWLAWLSAGIALTLPNRPAEQLPLNASLLLLVLLIVVFITRQARQYLQLMKRRPPLLAMDIVLGWLVLVLSGNTFLPFGLNALGSLIAPGLLFGWRGAMIGAGLCSALMYLNSGIFTGSQSSLPMHIGIPFLFALTWTGLVEWWQQSLNQSSNTGDTQVRPASRMVDIHQTTLGANEAIRRPPEWYSSASGSVGSRSQVGTTPTVSLRPDLQLAIRQLVDSERQRGGLQVEYQIEGAVQRLTAVQQSVLLRTAQEALSNVRRHAHASSCQVLLQVDERTATLQIQDDGVGLLDGTYERPHLHALRALRYRITELDGQLAVFEGERGGLIVRVTLPLEP
ncbi:MAG: ATPase [Chloroflexus sp.]|nr:MAG: ATPase [Chloroflexus sp.]